MTGRLHLDAAGATHPGLQRRNNDDYFALTDSTKPKSTPDADRRCLATTGRRRAGRSSRRAEQPGHPTKRRPGYSIPRGLYGPATPGHVGGAHIGMGPDVSLGGGVRFAGGEQQAQRAQHPGLHQRRR